jgi:inner membrane protein involved in colicin E2 resistance
VGAVASFVAVAMAMYLTRKIDWYGSLSDKLPVQEGPA